jgi:uncharacterized protein YukE
MRGMSNSDRQVISALKDFQRQWEETSALWHDQARADFEKEYIQELLPAAKTAVAAMGELDRLLKQAIQDCS